MIKRKYSISDSDLLAQAVSIVMALEGHLPSLTGIGITAEVIENFDELWKQAGAISQDIVVRLYASDEKKVVVSRYRKMTGFARLLSNMIGYTYGKQSQLYGEIVVTGMNTQNQEESLARVRAIHARLTELLPVITESHITQALLDEFAADIEAYTEARREYLVKKSRRAPTKNDRILAHNAVYDEMLRLTEIARAYLIAQQKYAAADRMKAIPEKYIRKQKRSRKKAAKRIHDEENGQAAG